MLKTLNLIKMVCETKDCNNKRLRGRRICSSCKRKRFKKAKPYTYFYHKLKWNAKRRNKQFHLTLQEYRRLWIEAGHSPGNGYHIDRIDVNGPYSYDNCQILSASDNSKKWHQTDQEYYNPYPEEAPF